MEKIKPIYKKIPINVFRKNEILRDRAGNLFITAEGVCSLLGTSRQTLNTSLRAAGLKPINRYINGHRPYMLEDVEQIYNLRK